MKVYVITFSNNYPSYHPKKGTSTGFIDKILNKVKTSTIRGNYDRWQKIRREVNKGNAYLSLRYWSDKPYRSKQIEFARSYQIATHRIFITNSVSGFEMSINGRYSLYETMERISKMEGFEDVEDFNDWFQKDEFEGVMIELEQIEKQDFIMFFYLDLHLCTVELMTQGKKQKSI